MTNGRVDHSVNRMRKNNFVAIQYFRRNRGLIKKVSLLDSETLDFDEVSFPIVLLSAELWKDKAFACAASRSAIIIITEIKQKWKERCILIEEVKLTKIQGDLIIKLLERFVEFYELPNAEVDVSGIGDELLITVGSTIIPVEINEG